MFSKSSHLTNLQLKKVIRTGKSQATSIFKLYNSLLKIHRFLYTQERQNDLENNVIYHSFAYTHTEDNN